MPPISPAIQTRNASVAHNHMFTRQSSSPNTTPAREVPHSPLATQHHPGSPQVFEIPKVPLTRPRNNSITNNDKIQTLELTGNLIMARTPPPPTFGRVRSVPCNEKRSVPDTITHTHIILNDSVMNGHSHWRKLSVGFRKSLATPKNKRLLKPTTGLCVYK